MKSFKSALKLGTFLVAIVLVLSTARLALALPIIADFTADYQTPTPAAGWAYMHNGAFDPIGTEGYTVNQYNATGNWYTTGGCNLPQPSPGGYSVVGSDFMHPGAGAVVSIPTDSTTSHWHSTQSTTQDTHLLPP